MTRPDYPVTTAVRALRDAKVEFTPHLYPFVEHGGTHHVSEHFHIPEHRVIKTLVMQDDGRRPFIVLMHGDREVSTRQLARELGVKRVEPCSEKDAQRCTGYVVGGISPIAQRTPLPTVLDETAQLFDTILVSAGKRGLQVELAPADLLAITGAVWGDIAR